MNILAAVLITSIAVLSKSRAGEPTAPFNIMFRPKVGVSNTALDLRITAMTNRIAAMPMALKNGRAEVLALPIRIDNHSHRTIRAEIAHEWFGGIWPPTDLGAAVRRIDDPMDKWRASEVYLVGQLGTLTVPTVWEPGQSHDFVLRMNWPGTGSIRAKPLMDISKPSQYVVKVSLIFKAGESFEYAESPPMEIKVTAK